MTSQKQKTGHIPFHFVNAEMKTQKLNYEINYENGP